MTNQTAAKLIKASHNLQADIASLGMHVQK